MEKIAQGKFNFSSDAIKNTKRNNKDDSEGQTRDILRKWANNVRTHQVIVSMLPSFDF